MFGGRGHKAPPHLKRTEIVAIKLTPAEKAHWEQAFERAQGRARPGTLPTMSTFVRMMVEEAIRRDMEPMGTARRPADFMRPGF